MSKKTELINESTRRRWAQLAKLPMISESFGNKDLEEDADLDESADADLDENADADLDESAEADLEEVETQNQSRDGGAPDRLHEMGMDDEFGDEDGGMDMAPEPEMGMDDEMGGDEIAGEATVEDLVVALAQTMSDVSGVPIEVEGAGAEGGEMDMDAEAPVDMEPAGDELDMQDDGLEDEEEEMMAEDTSPVGAVAHGPDGNKVTKQGDMGTITDPEKASTHVDGVSKAPVVNDGKGNASNTLEEKIYRKVLARLIKEVKSAKLKKEGVASPAKIPAKAVSKPRLAEKKNQPRSTKARRTVRPKRTKR